ncbi:MAG: cobyrinate a,c-diamide synthase [Kiloniellales bacterium]|nr:cobyrinate a,c-diamide synthase [Kiloniellales bacterium]
MPRGLLIAAPASGSGKTLVTLALLRYFRDAGLTVGSIKVGPDYIDPAFHRAASGRPCFNLDSWAMRPATLAATLGRASAEAELILGEGVMGLFDGAGPQGLGSTASLAAATGWPVVLVVDARGMGASAAALVEGFLAHRPASGAAAPIAGVVFNRVGGPGHADLLRAACAGLPVPVLGCLRRRVGLALPERHLGLVQAVEHPDLEAFLEAAAAAVGADLDLEVLADLARPAALDPGNEAGPPLPPLGQRIAVARDPAFAFAYPALLEGWRAAGAELSFFSPLDDAAPDPAAEAVYLPGGYPELQAGRLAGNHRFLEELRDAAARGAAVYGECGGYMVLGQALIDAEGVSHAMAGLLPVTTSFAAPRLSLGYREVVQAAATPLGPAGAAFRGHEFHYATKSEGEAPPPLFQARDALGRDLGPLGSCAGRVFGSFIHLIDRA